MMTERSSPLLDDPEFRDLFLAHFDKLVTFLMARTNVGRHGAEDLAQEVMLRAWRSLPTLVGDVQDLGPWLRTVARRIAIDTDRARRARPEEILCGPLPDPTEPHRGVDHNEQVLDRVTVYRLLRDLGPGHRAVVELFYLHDMDIRSIAHRLSIPVGTVKSRLHHALRLMRRQERTRTEGKDHLLAR